MNSIHFIKQNGRKAFAVIPYPHFKKMLEHLDDYACLKTLLEAKADPDNRHRRPLDDFMRERGII